MELVLFYAFAAVTVVASLFVIGQRNAMYSVLLLIASFGGLSGLYVLLEAPFVAVIQIIIYAGAIMVLFLFVVMLLNIPQEEAGTLGSGGRMFGALLALVLGLELIWAIASMGEPVSAAAGAGQPAAVTSVRDIGVALFTDHAFAFEATSILILVALIGAVVLARRER